MTWPFGREELSGSEDITNMTEHDNINVEDLYTCFNMFYILK